jgi:hypothetical protein
VNGRDGVEQGVGIGTTRATFFCFWFFFAALVSTSTAAEGLLFPSLTLLPALSQPNLSLSRARPLKHTGEKKKKQVWKTYLGRNRGTGTLEAVRDISTAGGAPAFWGGTGAKMVESASKGLILMWSKESLLGVLEKAHVSPGAWWMAVQRGGGKGEGTENGRKCLPRLFLSLDPCHVVPTPAKAKIGR